MKIIKFGGTALQTPTLMNNAVDMIRKADEKMVVVLSAIGRKGFPYATETLIESLKGSYLSPKEMDRLLSLGETYSALLFSNELNKQHIQAYSLSYREIGLICDKQYGKGTITSLSREKIKSIISRYQVVIVPGFIAKSSEYEVITLGRGTSDYSAVLIGEMLDEKEVTLFKDVDGVYPTIQYPLTKQNCFEYLSYEEALALCDIGYPIINREAVKRAEEQEIRLIVRNFNLNERYTTISRVSCGYPILGFNLSNNLYKIAAFHPETLCEELDALFKKHHIFIKNFQVEKQCLSFSITASQGLLIRQLLLNRYFRPFLR